MRAVVMTLLSLPIVLLGTTADATHRSKKYRSHPPYYYGPPPARIICGQTGCFEIPPGCTGEVRRSGKGVVAVVMCGH
jgi:hypothetical protein